ncbi:MAG TPA: vanadium-dependent haloperoxidase [Blastocatellia bacterium]
MKKNQNCNESGSLGDKAMKPELKDGAEDLAPPYSQSRRSFIKSAGGVTAITLAAGAVALEPFLGSESAKVKAGEVGPLNNSVRQSRAHQIRIDAANLAASNRSSSQDHISNVDEAAFPNKIGNFSKGLPHHSNGEVVVSAYNQLIRALTTGKPADFERITMGCPDLTRRFKFINPQAGLAFDLEGDDGHKPFVPPANSINSRKAAIDICENYWMALLRDLPFEDYDSSTLAQEAAAELDGFGSDFMGPMEGGHVTTNTLFRGNAAGCLNGPFVSQFLMRPAPFGAQFVDQRLKVPIPGNDHLTSFNEYLVAQNGFLPAPLTLDQQYLPGRRYPITGRDLTAFVHIDVLFQAYFNALLILQAPGDPDSTFGGVGCPLNSGNPYTNSLTQFGFGTFGPPGIQALLGEVASRALKAQWFQKWYVHRRLRPENMGSLVHLTATNQQNYPIDGAILNSQAVSKTFTKYGTGLLPQAFPEGCPTHPSYGAGHATVAGACVTLLKALFDEDFVITDPVMPTPDGSALVPYVGPPLTVKGELHKLGFNIALGRNIGGVHWRSDALVSLPVGEQITISILRDQRLTYNETFAGYTFTKFDGTTITV